MKLLLDTNIIVDYVQRRGEHYHDARKLMLLGHLKEVDLWMSAAQFNDLFYVLTSGGSKSLMQPVKENLQKLREFVRIYPIGEVELDAALASSWSDVEDCCLYQVALSLRADFILTRNQKDFELSTISAVSATEYFAHLKDHKGLTYEEIDLLL